MNQSLQDNQLNDAEGFPFLLLLKNGKIYENFFHLIPIFIIKQK